MQKIADTWYCSFSELANSCLISENTIKQGIIRGSSQWESTPDPDDKRRRLIRYDTMAEKYQVIVRQRLCGGLEPWEIAAKKVSEVLSERSLSELLEQALMNGFRRYVGLYPASDTTRAAQKTQTCLARAAAVVELIGNFIQDRELDRRSYKYFDEVETWLKQDDNYGYYFPKGNQYLPSNSIRIKEKVALRFGWKPGRNGAPSEPVGITEVIALPRKGNKSRDKFASDAELMGWLTIARANMDNSGTPDTYIARKIKQACLVHGREVPSSSWFSGVLSSLKMKQLTAPTRFGAGTKQAGRYTKTITMARAMYAGDCWMMDATRVNFIEHETAKNSKEYASLVVIAVRDAYSGEIVGVHFDTKEDRWAYSNALKMAVKSTGYLPHTLVYDRFPGHFSDEMQSVLAAFERKGVELVCTHKATGKALLERWWDTLQTVFFTNSRYYYGEGIRSTRAYAHRSPEYLLKMRKEAKSTGWDFDQAWQEAWKRIEEYRQTPISHYSRKHSGLDLTPGQLHEQSEKPNVIPIELWDQASLFWMTKVLNISDAGTIRQTVHGDDYEYQIYDEKLLYRYKRAAVRYEESDPANVMLFAVGADDKVTDFFICELAHVTPIAMYGKEAEKARLAGRMEKNKQFEERKKAERLRIESGASVDPEYLLNLAQYIPKEEHESVQTTLIYEQMGVTVAAEAHVPASKKRAQPPKPKQFQAATSEEPFDPKSFVNNSFFNQ